MALHRYLQCLILLCCTSAQVAYAAPAPNYDVFETTKGTLVVESGSPNPTIYLRDNRTVYALHESSPQFWNATRLSSADEKAISAQYPNALIPYNATTTLYVKAGAAHFRLSATDGGFSESAPLQERSFLLIAGENSRKIHTAASVRSPVSTTAAQQASPPAATQEHAIPVPTCKTGWPAAAEANKPFGGMFYGIAAHGEGSGFTKQYNYQASIRFRADRTGTVKEVSFLNKLYRTSDWNALLTQYQGNVQAALAIMRDQGTHRGNGGALRVEIRTDSNGKPSDTVLAHSLRDVSPIGAHSEKVGTLDNMEYRMSSAYDTFPTIRLDRMARVEAGKIYHIVLTQTSPKMGRVAMAGNKVGSPLTPPGGPYYGCSPAVMWRDSQDDSWHYAPQLLPLYSITYSDGTVLGQTVEARNNYEQIIGASSIVRQQFTVRGESMEVTGFYIRMRRQLGTEPLYATLQENNSALVSLSIPPETFPQISQISQPMPWTYIAFPKRIPLVQDKTYRLQLFTDASTRYAIGVDETPYDLTRDTKLVWGGQLSQAQNSIDGGKTWDNWATGNQLATRKATERPNADLPILFTIANKPIKLQ